LDGLKLFQWAGKLLYGIIFNEIQAGIKMHASQGEEFNISQAIIHKFSHLHLMLQSVNLPIEFEGLNPIAWFYLRWIMPKSLATAMRSIPKHFPCG
jgi:hypothetical protein